jgi:hypothetical protein
MKDEVLLTRPKRIESLKAGQCKTYPAVRRMGRQENLAWLPNPPHLSKKASPGTGMFKRKFHRRIIHREREFTQINQGNLIR